MEKEMRFKLGYPCNKELFNILSSFNKKRDLNHDGIQEIHHGIDIALPAGSDIFAVCDGRIQTLLNDPKGFGKCILHHAYIDNTDYYFYYAHLSEFCVKPNEEIKKRQKIALSGNTGHSTGPHLHLQMMKGSYAVKDYNSACLDPSQFFS